MEILQEILSRMGLGCVLAEDGVYLLSGIAVGMTIGLLVVLAGFVTILVMRQRHRNKGISIASENGEIFISPNAVREFVAHVMAEFEDVALHGAWIRQCGRGHLLKLAVHMAYDVDTVKLCEQIKRRVTQQMRGKLGVEADRPLTVTIIIRGHAVPEREGGAPAPGSNGNGSEAAPASRNPLTGFPPQLGSNLADDEY